MARRKPDAPRERPALETGRAYMLANVSTPYEWSTVLNTPHMRLRFQLGPKPGDYIDVEATVPDGEGYCALKLTGGELLSIQPHVANNISVTLREPGE